LSGSYRQPIPVAGRTDRERLRRHALASPDDPSRSPGPGQPGDPLITDDRAALGGLDDLATDYRDDDPDAGTVLPTDPAEHALERLVRAGGADRLPLTETMLAEAHRTARQIITDPHDPLTPMIRSTLKETLLRIWVRLWMSLSPTDRTTGWAAWQLVIQQKP